ncbi:MAG: arginyl-tRNA synthetase [Parcubacteria group bacterium Licking1014_1]|nr:MAG: arginyl-tRNA synthetase [Parcubacteria group bacterium Licking1014_1]
MINQEIKKIIKASIKDLQQKEKWDNFLMPEVLVECPREKIHGDYSASVAFLIAKIIKKNPFEAATLLKIEIEKQGSLIIQKVEVVNGFINFFVSESYLQNQVPEILKKKEKYGSLKIGQNKKVNIEFVSANPTGPLTLGNGRGGFCGDALANVLTKAGYKVSREYYINDTGAQIKKLGHSVIGDAEAVYKGEYIDKLRKKLLGGQTPQYSAEKVGERAAKIILEKMIKPSVKKMGIKFDKWFSEKGLYKNKEVDESIDELSKKGFTYKSEGAVWFKSKDLGDDKDRVLARADGIKTYFASDIAYLKNKFKRGFKKLVIFLGADHYGYVPRLKAASQAFGFGKDSIDAIVMQLVRLFEKGKEVRMSKRTGIYITIDELIDEVGLDVARFFFLMISSNTHMNFNLDLAKEKSEKNPIFKVQYAYVRINSIIKKCQLPAKISKPNFSLLQEESELNLIKQLVKLPEIIEDCAKDYQVQRLPQYAMELADSFHKFYETCRVILDDKKLTKARIALVMAAKIVLKNTLNLMGISTPEKM